MRNSLKKTPKNQAHGWLNINKPIGMSSAKVVAMVRRHFNLEKIGHGGTLDPLASGVLPIAIGEATKTAGYTMDKLKGYRFRVKWGEARATDDAEGDVIATSDKRPTQAEIEAVLPKFLGEIEQIPPIYSAIKVDGRRAYALARKGQDVELAARKVWVQDLVMESIDDENHATFRVISGKGFYIRSLARDLAACLGTVSYVDLLIRTKVGHLVLEETHTLDYVMDRSFEELDEMLLDVDVLLDDILALTLTEDSAKRLIQGQSIPAEMLEETLEEGKVVRVKVNGLFIAIARFELGVLKPLRIFNLWSI